MLTSCGENRVSPPEEAETGPVRCQEVWVVGHRLPADYSGCLRGGRKVAPMIELHCTHDAGNYLVSYKQRLLAVRGGKVFKTHDGRGTTSMFAC